MRYVLSHPRLLSLTPIAPAVLIPTRSHTWNPYRRFESKSVFGASVVIQNTTSVRKVIRYREHTPLGSPWSWAPVWMMRPMWVGVEAIQEAASLFNTYFSWLRCRPQTGPGLTTTRP